MKKIAILDYGLGNILSLKYSLNYLGYKCFLASEVKNNSFDCLIIPGVGSYSYAMSLIKNKQLNFIKKAVTNDILIIGICLGMQLLIDSSEEGNLRGLGWISGQCKKFNNDNMVKLKIPHMGWNTTYENNQSNLTKGLPSKSQFYFVHSYFVTTSNNKNSILKTKYIHEFDSAIQKDNIFGVQFHPEKSHRFGMKIIENFLNV